MSDTSSFAQFSVSPATPPRPAWYHWRRIGFNFLTLSILGHFFLGIGATYLVVQNIQAKRKQTFGATPASPNAPTRALEHKVQMQKKQQTMSAPAPLKRITTTSNTKVALPAMPAMPKLDSTITPLSMAGMGGTGIGLGAGGGGGGGGNGGGGGLSLFGIRDGKGSTLRGTLFDLKQTPDNRPTPIAKNDASGNLSPQARQEYKTTVAQFVQGGMHDSTLTARYFKGPNPLYATQIYIPQMDAAEGPKAFGLQGRVQPSRWLVHYQGTVVAPDSGTFRFVGVADDVLVVRFNDQVVLDCGSMYPSGHIPGHYYLFDGLNAYAGWFKGCGEGSSFTVEAGKSYPIDIVIGEWPGGKFEAFLQLRNEAVEYKKDTHGNPILPLFRLTPGTLPSGGLAPVYDHDGPVWRGTAAPPTAES